MTERPDPAQLCEPAFEPPVVRCRSKQLIILGFSSEQCARIGAQVFDAVLREPLLNFSQGMSMFLRMPILIAQPRLASIALLPAIAQHRIEWDQPIPRELLSRTAEAHWQTRERVVQPEHDHAARSSQARQSCERRAGIRRVMQHA